MEPKPTPRKPDRSDREGLAAALTPAGRLRVFRTPDGAEVAPAVAARIVAAFDRGPGHGLLHLGAEDLEAALPPDVAFWRDLGRLYVAHLCGLPDAEDRRRDLEVPDPADELSALARAAPPMTGGEYLGTDALGFLWKEIDAACREELARFRGTVEAYLQSRNPAWHLVGRVHFHLAENKADPDAPFAFLVTYTTRLSGRGTPQHRPLGQAVREFAGAGNRPKLLRLLEPVQRAAAVSDFVRALVDSRAIYEPCAWTPAEAYRFLKDLPAVEKSGVVVRVPDWWRAKRPPRPEVRVSVGGRAPAGLGLDALLDFDVGVTLDGERLTEAELKRLLSATAGLALVRGKWVELDPDRLREVLDHWNNVQATAGRDGVSFLEGMRLLSGAGTGTGTGETPPHAADWSQVVAGDWLRQVLEGLRAPESLAAAEPGRELRTELRPYQVVGVRWLYFLHGLGLGACLADDMGLGKTVQVLALLLALKRRERCAGRALLVVPASLVANWKAEIDRFAPSLDVLIAHPSASEGSAPSEVSTERLASKDLVITTYGFTLRVPALAAMEWRLVILDEAQAIKNPDAKQARAVKALKARSRVALTGTPVENRLMDLWSIFDFLNPGLLGSAKVFTGFAKDLAERPGGYAPLRELTRPYILRRLKTDKRIIADLPEKTELRAFCALSKTQAALYQESVQALSRTLKGLQGIERRGAVLAFLLRLKQICNHPSQWLHDGGWNPADSGKFARLRELCEVIADKQEKVLVFTQFRETTEPLSNHLAGVFGRRGLVLHGETPVKERRGLVERFQQDDAVPYFVLSIKAGGTGLNLTAATHVIHFDRWWNPAVENQATDRAFRIGQKKNVLVHKFVCRGTVEERIDALIESKQGMAREVLETGGEAVLTELDDSELLRIVSLDIHAATAEA